MAGTESRLDYVAIALVWAESVLAAEMCVDVILADAVKEDHGVPMEQVQLAKVREGNLINMLTARRAALKDDEVAQ